MLLHAPLSDTADGAYCGMAALSERLKDGEYRRELDEIVRSGVVAGRNCALFEFVEHLELEKVYKPKDIEFPRSALIIVSCALDLIVLDSNDRELSVASVVSVLEAMNSVLNVCTGDIKGIVESGFSALVTRFLEKHGGEYENVFNQVKIMIENSDLQTNSVFDILLAYLQCMINGKLASKVEIKYVGLVQMVSMNTEVPRYYADRMMDQLMPSLERLDISALSISAQLLRFIGHGKAVKLFETFPAFIASSLMRVKPPFELPSLDDVPGNVIELPEYSNPEVNLNLFTARKERDRTTDSSVSIKFPQGTSYESLLSLEWKSKLGLIIAPVRGEETDDFIRAFLESLALIKIEDIPHRFQAVFCASIVYVFYLWKSDVTPEVLRNLCMPPVFDPRVTVYDNYDQFEIFDILRNAVVNIILTGSEKCFQFVIVSLVRYPLLFSELVIRFLNKGLRGVSFAGSGTSILMRALLYYEQRDWESMSEEQIKAVTIAEGSLCRLISRLREENGSQYFLSKVFLVSSLLSLALSDVMLPWVLIEVSSLLMHSSELPMNAVEGVSQFLGMVSCCFSNFKSNATDGKKLRLITSLFKCFNDALSQNRALGRSLSRVNEMIVNMLPSVPCSDDGREFLLTCFGFLSHTSVELTVQEVTVIEKVLTTSFHDHLDETLADLLSRVVIANAVPALRSGCLISNPCGCRLLLSVFRDNTNVLKANIKQMTATCRYSRRNSRLCHQWQLDLYVLGMLKELSSSSIDRDLISDLLELFMTIGSTVSSVVLVNRYANLFVCEPADQLSSYEDLFLSALNQEACNTLHIPYSSMAFSNAACIALWGVTGDMISEGFTFSIWIYTEGYKSHVSKPTATLLEIADTRQRSISLLLSSEYLTVREINQKRNFEGKVDRTVPTRQWTFITFTYRFSGDRTYALVDAYINSRKAKTIEFLPLHFESGPLTVVVGGGTELTGDELFGPFGLFKYLEPESVAEIYALGPRNIARLPVDPVFFFTLCSDNDHIDVVPHHNSSISAIMPSRCVESEKTFIDVIVNQGNIDIFIPIFTQLDMTKKDGTTFPGFMRNVLDLFANLLKCSPLAQESFMKARGFELISYQLSVRSNDVITYDLYKQLFLLMNSLTVLESQLSLLDQLVMNLSLWMRCGAETQIKVLRHWYRCLMPTFHNYLNQNKTFRKVIFALRMSYNDAKASGMTLYNEHADEAREILFNLAKNLAMEEMTEDDFLHIGMNCLACSGPEPLEKLLLLVKELASTDPSPFSKFKPDLTLLFMLLPTTEVRIILLIIEILLAFSDVFMGFELTKKLEILSGLLTPEVMTGDFMKQLFELDQYRLFPIICQTACFCSPEEKSWLIHQLEPSPNFVVDFMWSVWAVALAYTLSGDDQSTLLKFLVLCNQQIVALFSVIDCVGNALELDSASMNYSMLVVCLSVGYHLDEFVRLTKFFILYRRLSERNVLQDRVERPLGTEKVPVNLIDKISPMDCQFLFGIRFLPDMTWEDLGLVHPLLEVLAKDRKYLDLDLMLSAFLAESDPMFVVSHLKRLNLSRCELEEYKPFLALIHHHLHMKDCDNELAFLCLQRQALLIDHEIMRKCARFINGIVTRAKERAQEIHNMNLEQRKSDAIGEIELISETYNDHHQTNSRMWVKFWRNITQECAPWHSESTSSVRYERDNTICSNFCPCKLKRCWKATDYARSDQISPRTAKKFSETIPTEKTQYKLELPCRLITPREEKDAIFSLARKFIRIRQSKTGRITIIKLSRIKMLLFRRVSHLPNSLEIFTHNGKPYFVMFPGQNSLKIVKQISRFGLPNASHVQTIGFRPYFEQLNFTKLWKERKISNFTYLMRLNVMSGRTFNDLSQYPIFPWILSDYDSPDLDLTDKRFFRDLAKPIGALDPEKLGARKSLSLIRSQGRTPSLYESTQMSLMTVITYLMRVEPFTSIHLDLQNGVFDRPERLFTSVGGSFRLLTFLANDFRELVPEFFCTPDFLVNINKYSLETTNPNDDVTLPKWAKNAFDFVYMHRKALESEIVSQNLHHWIDLIWGKKQRGRHAVDADNTYSPEFYDDIWTDEQTLNNEQMRTNIENILRFMGQIPPQLFVDAHPMRNSETEIVQEKTGFELLFKDDFGARFSAIWETEHHINVWADGHASVPKKEASNTRMIRISTVDSKKPPICSKTTLEVRDPINDTFVSGGFLYIQTQKNSLTIFNTITGVQIGVIDDVSGFCVDGDYIGTSGRDGSLGIYRGHKFLFRIQSFRDAICCCAINVKFFVVVSGTADGSIILSSLNKGSTLKVVALDGATPRMIHVTNGWGFILVLATKDTDIGCEHFLFLFSINGDLLKTVNLGHVSFTKWISFVSPDGFDYVIAADDRGRVYIFEAYFCETAIEKCYHHCGSRVLDLHFSKIRKRLSLALLDGSILANTLC